LIHIRAATSEWSLDAFARKVTEAAMWDMMRDGVMTGHMGWGMGLSMGVVTVVLVLGAVALIKYIVAR
jgi:hypothetical protein